MEYVGKYFIFYKKGLCDRILYCFVFIAVLFLYYYQPFKAEKKTV
jgi:hypothetical protein